MEPSKARLSIGRKTVSASCQRSIPTLSMNTASSHRLPSSRSAEASRGCVHARLEGNLQYMHRNSDHRVAPLAAFSALNVGLDRG